MGRNGPWKWGLSKWMNVTQSCPTLCDPMDYTVHGILQARILEWVALPLLQGFFPTQGSNPGLPHCRRIFLPAEPQGKPKNTGVGSLSLLQWIFLTQESNQGPPHCRQIVYQLSYQGSWNWRVTVPKTTELTLVRPLMINLKKTVRADCAVSECSLPPTPTTPHTSIHKSSSPLTASAGGGGKMSDTIPPPGCWHLKENKLFFPPTWLVYWLLSSKQQDPHTLFQ